MTHQIYNSLGLFGVFLILVAYFLLQIEKIKSSGMAYALYNIIGSVLILVSLYDKPNIPAIIMELAWTAISIYSVIKILKR
ncbi:MAG: hypothetical protein M1561_02840 [Gammaproteobacteria bacterium]|nr:hypothetical protein [Gammaproteobacteria bacterium]